MADMFQLPVFGTAGPIFESMASDDDLNADDAAHEFLGPEAWAPLPNARKLSAAYNRPFERNFRMRLRRATTYESMIEIIEPHEQAADALGLAAMIRERPEEAHLAPARLEYYPHDRSVWRNGEKWLVIPRAN